MDYAHFFPPRKLLEQQQLMTKGMVKSIIYYYTIYQTKILSIYFLLTYLISTTANFVHFKLLVWMSTMLRKVTKNRYRLIPEVGYNSHLEMQY